MDRWVGKVAVVTGASSGIGAAIAVDLVKAGMIVVGLGRRLERLDELRVQIPKTAVGKFQPYSCDISNDSSVEQAFQWIASEFGAVHVLVNNVGTLFLGQIIDEGNEEDLKSVFQTNVWGLVLCTKKAVEIMKRQKVIGAHIINMNSVPLHMTGYPYPDKKPFWNVYPAAKHAVTALSEILRQEFNYDNLQFKVTNISPGCVRTSITGDDCFFDDVAHLQPEDIAQAVLYALGTPPHVNILDVVIKPIGELF